MSKITNTFTDKKTIISAAFLNSVVDHINDFEDYIGSLEELSTEDKTSLVNAVNEAITKIGTKQGKLTAGASIKINDDDTISVVKLTDVTYDELKELVTNANLQPGAFYRIIDYVTMVNGKSAGCDTPNEETPVDGQSRSAGWQFDIVVQALSTSELDENAVTMAHEGVEYPFKDFGDNATMNGWIIKYYLDNINWSPENGKGTIIEMTDYANNHCYYDFLNIQYYREKTDYIDAGWYYTFSTKTFLYAPILRNSINKNNKSKILNNTVIILTEESNNSRLFDNNIGINYNNTIIAKYIYGNNIKHYFYNNTIVSTTIIDNDILKDCYNNTITVTSDFRLNNITLDFFDNVITVEAFWFNNILARFCTNNIKCTNFAENTILDTFKNNELGINGNFSCNTINNFQNNSSNEELCTSISYNIFEYNCCNIIFGNASSTYVNFCAFRENSFRITFDGKCEQLCFYGSCRYLNIYGSSNMGINTQIYNVRGASDTNRLTINLQGDNYRKEIFKAADGKIIHRWHDGTKYTGLYLNSNTDTEWKEYVAEDYVQSSLKGIANGVATLDASGRIPSSQLPTTARQIVGEINTANVHTLPDITNYKAGDELLVTAAGYYTQSLGFSLAAGNELTEMEVTKANGVLATGIYTFILKSEDSVLGTIKSFATNGVTLTDDSIISLPYSAELTAVADPETITVQTKVGDEIINIDSHWVLLSNNSSVESVNGATGAVTISAESLGVIPTTNIDSELPDTPTDNNVPSTKLLSDQLANKANKKEEDILLENITPGPSSAKSTYTFTVPSYKVARCYNLFIYATPANSEKILCGVIELRKSSTTVAMTTLVVGNTSYNASTSSAIQVAMLYPTASSGTPHTEMDLSVQITGSSNYYNFDRDGYANAGKFTFTLTFFKISYDPHGSYAIIGRPAYEQ